MTDKSEPRTPGPDLSQRGQTPETLIARDATADNLKPDDSMNPNVSAGLQFLAANEFKKLPPPEFIIDRLLPSGLSVLFADANIGKSFFALAVGSAIARNLPLFKAHAVLKSGTVIFILPEGPRSWAKRLNAYDSYHDLPSSPNMIFVTELINLQNSKDWARLDEFYDNISNENNEPPALIIIDTLAAATPGVNENSIEEMGLVMNRLQSFVSRGTSVLVCHHANKNGEYRGHSSIRGNCDNMFKLTMDRKTGVREFVSNKLKDEESISCCSFQIKPTELGAVPVNTNTQGPWERIKEIDDQYPGLCEAMVFHGLVVPGYDIPDEQVNNITTGVSLREINTTWNDRTPPEDRPHRNRRQRSLIRCIKILLDAEILHTKNCSLTGTEAKKLNAVVHQPETP